MEFITLGPEIASEWDRVVYDSDDGWAYGLSAWLQRMNSVWNRKSCDFAISENGKILAVMPLSFVPDGAVLASGGWTTGGPMVVPGISDAKRTRVLKSIFAHVDEIAAQTHATCIRVSISPLNESSLKNRWSVNPLVEFGFTDTSTHTWMVDLEQTESQLWSRLSENARWEIKQARTAGYSVRACPWSEMLDDYYRVHVETYLRTEVTPQPKSNFEALAEVLAPAGQSVLWACFDREGRPVAFHNSTRFKRTAFFHSGCSETAHLKSGTNYLLFWESIIGAKRDGCAWYDCGEATPQARDGKTRGLTVFKGKFGGELHRWFKGEIVLGTVQTELPLPAGASEVQPEVSSPAGGWLDRARNLVVCFFRK